MIMAIYSWRETIRSHSFTMTYLPIQTNVTRPQCFEIYKKVPYLDATPVSIHILLNILGIISNVCLLSAFSGRLKLGTASFTYVRVLAIVQFVFFILPYPLKVLTEHYQRGQTWIAANFLPLILAFFQFAISSLVLCFAVRLQLIINYIRRCRRWSSIGWVAWRKICYILPFGIIVNISLCFEYNLDYEICLLGNRTHAIGRARVSEVVKGDRMKLEFIRATPVLIFWLTVSVTMTFLLSERFLLPKLASPYAAKHIPLLRNISPLILAIVVSHSFSHIIYTYNALHGIFLSDLQKMSFLAISYSLPFPLMFTVSSTFRSHIFHILTKLFQGRPRRRYRKDSTIRKVTKHITRNVAFSKLEMENSEFEEGDYDYGFRGNSTRAILRDDAVYRIRFAMPNNVEVIEEEDEANDRMRDSLGVEEHTGTPFIVNQF